MPLMIDFEGKRVIVIGGGRVGLRKARTFRQAGAEVEVVSREFARGFAGLPVKRTRVDTFDDLKMLGTAFLVIAATDDPELNARIYSACRGRGVLCNVVDDPRSEVYMPSIVSRGPLTVAISTGGASPALAKRARQEIEGAIGPAWGGMAALLGEARNDLKRSTPSQATRRRTLSKIIEDEGIWRALESGDRRRARRLMKERYLRGSG
jgi:siroheme synthase-like protein